jgi:hypothetical protein
MVCRFKEFIRVGAACLLALMFVLPTNLLAETVHVVSPSDLHSSAARASQTRQQNAEKVEQFLSSNAAQSTLRSAHLDPAQVKTAVSSLNDQELATMAARADKAQKDFAAGYLDNRDIALIVLGIAVLILIIVIAK